MEKEIRSLKTNLQSDDNRHISGYALVFDSESEDLGFREYIHPEAVNAELIANSDVFALLNHEDDKILARSKYGVGNLSLTIDERGLKYDFDALDNELGNTVLTYIRSGIIDSSSFAFAIDPEDESAQKWTRNADGSLRRDIYKFARIYDISPVYSPAYAATSCSCRSLDKFLEEEKRAQEEANEALEKEYQEYLYKINSME